mgnify:CR=1 FL=1
MYKWIMIVLLAVTLPVKAQELNCTVKVGYDMVTDANTQIFKTLEKSLGDFVNNTRWTTRNFGRNEKIECSMFINVLSYSNNQFTANLQVQASRPIYGSTYSSPILNINDKDFAFNYTEYENLYFNPNSFTSNLMSVVAFYANIIIGMDADSFQKGGGTPYYEVAQAIVTQGQQSGYAGWSQQEGGLQNRYFLVNNILSNTYESFRDALYEYHLAGLDHMSEDIKGSKENIIKAVKTLSKLHSVRPNAYLTRVFFDAKSDEIVSIFSGGPAVTLTELSDTLNRISPLNSSKWSNIK